MRIIISGGGTGGHLFPAVAVGEEIMRRQPDTELLFVGSSDGLEAKWLPGSGLKYELLEVHGLRGHSLVHRVKAITEFAAALIRARALLKRFGADVVISAGGYASAPVGAAAVTARIPLVLIEQNTRPGLANRMLRSFAWRICVGFDEGSSFFNPRKVVVTGNPIRFAPPPPKPVSGPELPLQILVLGGSSGAHRLNLGVVKAFRICAQDVHVQITHQTGEADLQTVAEAYRALGWDARAVPFIDDIGCALGRADLVIARAGAMTVSEVALTARPAIFVPYPFHRDRQQELNARVIEKLGGAIVIHDDDMLAESLAQALRELSANRSRLGEMSQHAAKAAKPDAAARIAEICMDAAQAGGGAV